MKVDVFGAGHIESYCICFAGHVTSVDSISTVITHSEVSKANSLIAINALVNGSFDVNV